MLRCPMNAACVYTILCAYRLCAPITQTLRYVSTLSPRDLVANHAFLNITLEQVIIFLIINYINIMIVAYTIIYASIRTRKTEARDCTFARILARNNIALSSVTHTYKLAGDGRRNYLPRAKALGNKAFKIALLYSFLTDPILQKNWSAEC